MPTSIVATTELVVVSIAETVLLPLFVTYARFAWLTDRGTDVEILPNFAVMMVDPGV
jgi:hypothetical protein